MLENTAAQLVLIAGLVLLNAFFAAAEIAIVSVRRSRVRQLVEEEHDRRAAAVVRLIEQPGHFLATIQVGVTVAGFFASAVGAVSLAVVVATWLTAVPVPVLSANAYAIAFVVVTTAIAFLTLVLGELAPKNLAIVHAEAIALRVARPVELLSKIAAPLVWILTACTTFVMRATGAPERARVPPISEEEILAMVASGEEEGVIAPAERRLIAEVFEFGDTTVWEVLVPRVDVNALRKEATLADARRAIIETGRTRLPVYDGTIDNIIGVIHTQDVLERIDPEAFAESSTLPVTTIMRPAYHVPASRLAADLLADLQRQQIHLAVAVDEFGGTAGIVTLDNILEELVGSIRNEHEPRAEPEIQIVAEGEAVVSGGADLDDARVALQLRLDTEEVDTVGGLIYAALGRIPRVGDIAQLADAELEVLAMHGRRVLKARVKRRERSPDEPRSAS